MKDDSDGLDGVDTDSGLLEPDESLDDSRVDDVLDEGYSPPERPWAVHEWGLTAREAAGHESLAGRLAREVPESTVGDGDGLGDTQDTDGELYDEEVGSTRSGRLAARNELYAVDLGVDGGAASAEEAAVHEIPE
jgi:hypothetical protein